AGSTHAGGMQRADMTQGVLPKPARPLREADSQAPPGAQCYCLYMTSHSLRLIPGGFLPACLTPFLSSEHAERLVDRRTSQSMSAE
ncbi:hypothetical protein KUCAC02_029894, partial [Chaenocephalus aceratus]